VWTTASKYPICLAGHITRAAGPATDQLGLLTSSLSQSDCKDPERADHGWRAASCTRPTREVRPSLA
jgi:hypothetical protein